jgi:hypothetical protein
MLGMAGLGVGAFAAPVTSSESESEGSEVIYGGQVQSVDPTRYDYVPIGEADPSIAAPASAWGQQWIGGFTIKVGGQSIGIPKMVLTHDITGSGLRIDREQAYTISGTGQVCNYRYDFQNRYGGAIYSTVTGTTRWSCDPIGTTWGGNNVRAPYSVKRGKQCARLFSNGVFIGEQCHSIN